MNYLRLNDVFSEWATDGGIFNALQSLDVPWQDLNISTHLDLLYHGNHGDRIVSPLVVKLLDDDNEISAANTTKLANAIYTLYGTNWNKLYATLSFDYNPISNYDMTETETIDNDTTNTVTNTGTVTTDNTLTKTGTVTTDNTVTKTGTVSTDNTLERTGTVTNDQDSSNSVYGFNSDSAVNADSQTLDNTVTNNLTDTLDETVTNNLTDDTDETVTNNLTDSIDETVTNNLSTAGTGTNDTERTLTRSGNIGVTTSQQMIESERELWKWKFFDHVFADLDDILTLKIY